MERSPPASQATEPSNVNSNEQTCFVCNGKLSEGQECLIISECNHIYHRSCIETYLSNSSECPNCKRPCALSELRKIDISYQSQPVEKSKHSSRARPRGAANAHGKHFTRSQARNLFNDPLTPLREENTNLVLLTPQRNPSNSNVNNSPPDRNIRQNQRFESSNISQNIDYSQLNNMIETTVSRLLQNLNLVPMPQIQNSNVQPASIPNNFVNTNENALADNHTVNLPTQTNSRPQNSNDETFRFNSRSSSSFDEHFIVRSNKITSMIQNWNLKFDGSCNGITVDEFLYRVRSLTEENFNNDFSLVCKNLHILLTGKARDWYWRYHKQVRNIDWKEFV